MTKLQHMVRCNRQCQLWNGIFKKIGLQDLCPQKGRYVRVGWQIDMFAGYSGVTPSLWALMGFDAMYMRWAGTRNVQDWTDVKGFEFIWEGSSTKNLASNFSRG